MLRDEALSKKILVVEDSLTFRSYLNQQLSLLGYDVYTAANYSEAQGLLEELGGFLCTVLDYCLPDAENGEVIDLALKHDQKAIVLSANFRDDAHNQLLQKGILDYLLKDSSSWITDLVAMISRLERNKHHHALVVDDSKTIRQRLKQLFEHQYIKTTTAKDGIDALSIMKKNRDISFIVIDYDMPNMDGITLLRSIRDLHDRNRLPILGLSGCEERTMLTARFLKAGANDFLYKPYNQEELFCRVHQLLDMKEANDKLYDLANKDELTGLWNRRYFFSHEHSCSIGNSNYSIAMLDIDHFKYINDNYGHSCGDLVIKTIANVLKLHFDKSTVARLGGEEFCICFRGEYSQFIATLEKMRQRIEKLSIPYEGNRVSVRISIGATHTHGPLNHQLTKADNLLYHAKQTGRNQLICD